MLKYSLGFSDKHLVSLTRLLIAMLPSVQEVISDTTNGCEELHRICGWIRLLEIQILPGSYLPFGRLINKCFGFFCGRDD